MSAPISLLLSSISREFPKVCKCPEYYSIKFTPVKAARLFSHVVPFIFKLKGKELLQPTLQSLC